MWGDGSNNWNLNGVRTTIPQWRIKSYDYAFLSLVDWDQSNRVKGDITVGTALLELLNTYTIGANNNYVQGILP